MENKPIKTILLVAAMIGVFTAGVLVGNITAGDSPARANPIETMAESVGEEFTAAKEVVTGNSDPNSTTSSVSDPGGVAFTVNIENLSDGQKTMLRGMGIDSNEIVVTNSMLACAEAKLESSRIEEIRNGAAPSLSEGITLMGCYSS